MIRVMNASNVKKAVRARDGYRCVDCGIPQDEYIEAAGRGLEVHRLKRGTPYTIEGCVTLCRKCHMRRHKKAGDLLRYGKERIPCTRSHSSLQLRNDWANVLYRLAEKAGVKPPRYLVQLMANAADREGIERPALPWESC